MPVMPQTSNSKPLIEIPMFITKAVKDGKVMKWAAVNSDTDPDSYAERMSVGLYQDFLSRINNKEPVPIFKSITSKFWQGGMPYLSISHYPDIEGQAVPGEPLEIYIDGNNQKAKLKAKGILYDTPLGHSVFRSLAADKDKDPEEKIRISIGFLDLAHKHGDDGELWERKSATSLCPECLQGVGQKIYVKGYLVHLALTRVPVNKRTEMVLEEKAEMAKKKITRVEDAASIVGEDLANEIDAKSKTVALKSDVLIEMSEAPVEEAVAEVAEVEVPVEPVVEEPVEPAAEQPEPIEPVAEPVEEAVEEVAEPVAKSEFEVKVLEMLTALTEKPIVAEEKSELVGDAHPLKSTLDALLSAVDNSLGLEGDVNAKLAFINAPLQEVGQAITDYVTSKSVATNEPPAPDKNNDNLIDEIKSLIQPVLKSVSDVNERLGLLEAKSGAANVEVRNRIPQPRSHQLPANLVAKSEPATKPGSLRDIINKSVGITE